MVVAVNSNNNDDDEELLFLWYRGLELWFNHCQYIEAMDVWQQAIDKFFPIHNNNILINEQQHSYKNLELILTSSSLSQEATSATASSSSSTISLLYDCGSDKIEHKDDDDTDTSVLMMVESWSSLLLFLGSCYLDTGTQMYMARKCFYQCFQCCVYSFTKQQSTFKTNNMQSIFVHAVLDYIASYEEEEETFEREANENEGIEQKSDRESHWLIARNVMSFAIRAMTLLSSSSTATTTTQINVDRAKQQLQPYWTNVYQRPMYMSQWVREQSCYTNNTNNSHTETYQSDETNAVEQETNERDDRNDDNYSTIIHDNCSCYKPIYERNEHPKWCKILEDHYPIILKELQRLLVDVTPLSTTTSSNNQNTNAHTNAIEFPHHWPVVGSVVHRNGAGEHDGKVVRSCNHTHFASRDESHSGGDWREIVLFGSSSTSMNGQLLAPETCRIIQTYIPDAVELAECGGGEIIFSVLRNNTHLLPHTASTNIRLTAHLGLIVPTKPTAASYEGIDNQYTNDNDDDNENHDCYIRIGETKCYWEPGKVLVFDDSYEHEVVFHNKNSNPRNDNSSNSSSTNIRAVLLIRFWHPCLQNNRKQQQLAIQEAIEMKEYDSLRRFCPPLPPPNKRTHNSGSSTQRTNATTSSSSVVKRCMEQTVCPQCWRNGYQSIRIESTTTTKVFVCLCGSIIDN